MDTSTQESHLLSAWDIHGHVSDSGLYAYTRSKNGKGVHYLNAEISVKLVRDTVPLRNHLTFWLKCNDASKNIADYQVSGVMVCGGVIGGDDFHALLPIGLGPVSSTGNEVLVYAGYAQISDDDSAVAMGRLIDLCQLESVRTISGDPNNQLSKKYREGWRDAVAHAGISAKIYKHMAENNLTVKQFSKETLKNFQQKLTSRLFDIYIKPTRLQKILDGLCMDLSMNEAYSICQVIGISVNDLLVRPEPYRRHVKVNKEQGS